MATAMGHHIPMFFVILVSEIFFKTTVLASFFDAFWAPDGPRHPTGHTALDWCLFVFLWLLYMPWILLLIRGRVGSWTGAGFTIAVTGLAARFLVQGYSHLGLVLDRIDGHLVEGIARARDLGLVAYFVGLTLVVSACITDMRLARTTPRWARFME